jgi:hypothetical protein
VKRVSAETDVRVLIPEVHHSLNYLLAVLISFCTYAILARDFRNPLPYCNSIEKNHHRHTIIYQDSKIVIMLD